MPPSGTGAPTAPASMSLPSAPCGNIERRFQEEDRLPSTPLSASIKSAFVQPWRLLLTFCRAAARWPSRWGPRFSRMSETYVYDTSWKLGVAGAPACNSRVLSSGPYQALIHQCGVLGASSAQKIVQGHHCSALEVQRHSHAASHSQGPEHLCAGEHGPSTAFAFWLPSLPNENPRGSRRRGLGSAGLPGAA